MIDKNVLDQQGLGLSLFADSMAQVPCLRQKKCFRSHAWIRVNGQCGFSRWRFAAVLCKAAKLVSRGSPSLFLQLLSTRGAFSQGGRGRKWPAFWAPFSRDPLRAVYCAGFAPAGSTMEVGDTEVVCGHSEKEQLGVVRQVLCPLWGW